VPADFGMKYIFTIPVRSSSIHINCCPYWGNTEIEGIYRETKNPFDLERDFDQLVGVIPKTDETSGACSQSLES